MEELLDKSFRTTGQLELPHFSHWAVCRGVVGVTASQTAPSPNHPRGASTEVHVPDSRNSFARLSQNVKRTTHKHTLVYTYGSTPWRAPTTPALSRSEVRKAGCCGAENDCLGKDLHCVLWNAPECSVHCSFLKTSRFLNVTWPQFDFSEPSSPVSTGSLLNRSLGDVKHNQQSTATFRMMSRELKPVEIRVA